MYDFHYALRHAALDATKDKPVQEKADALNLIEAIIDGEMSSEELMRAIMDGNVPVVYAPNA